MADSTILTGQFVRIQQVPASVGERMLALAIDWIAILIYFVSSAYLLVRLVPLYNEASLYASFFLLITYIPIIFYSLLCEVFNNGQSLGKKLMGIRVVKADGTTPTLGAYFLRWLLFFVDVPLTGGLGVVFVLLTQKHQRLGDLAAGTMVIKEKNYKKIQVSLDEFDYLTKNYNPSFPQAADLSLEQVNIISKTLSTPHAKRLELIAQLSAKVRNLLGIKQMNTSDEAFLNTLVRDYQYYALEIV